MGYVLVTGTCTLCHRLMMFSPTKVPSIRIKGEREPVCASCVAAAQAYQREHNLPVWPDPLPGAYEADSEEEIGDDPY